MYCPKCGWNNADDASECANCQADLASSALSQPSDAAISVPDFMKWSIVVTVIGALFCNLPSLVLGIISIIKSSSANNKKAAGDQTGAASEANTVKILCIVGTCLLVIGLIFTIPFWCGLLSFGHYSPH